jgi:hypothetical protein
MKNRAVIILSIGVMLASGCATSHPPAAADHGQSVIGGPYNARGCTRGGREVKATGDVTLGVTVQDDETVTLTFEEHTLTVKTDRVLLDGKVRAKLPPPAHSIQVACAKHKLLLVADNRRVLETKYE